MFVVSFLPQMHCCDQSGYEVIKNLLTLGGKSLFHQTAYYIKALWLYFG